MGYQSCKMCKLSSFKGHFCDYWNRRTSANKGWCKEIVIKEEYNKKHCHE